MEPKCILRFSFLKHCTVVGNVLNEGEYGPLYLTDLPSTSVRNILDVYRKPWEIFPTQIGTTLNPNDIEMCRIHREYINLEAYDDVCAQPPYALLGNRRWNLPNKHGFVIHSKRSPGIGDNDRVIPGVAAYWSLYRSCPVNKHGFVIHSKDNDRVIPGVAAYWSLYRSCPVFDVSGTMIGMKRCYNLVFDVGGRRAMGQWKAEEFTCIEKIDGNCCIVALYCTNERLQKFELELTYAENNLEFRVYKNFELAEKRKPVEEVESYIQAVGICSERISTERMLSKEKEERMGRGVLGDEGELPVDVEPVARRKRKAQVDGRLAS